jgi:hypothetical protein
MPFHKRSFPNPSPHTRSFLLCILILWIQGFLPALLVYNIEIDRIQKEAGNPVKACHHPVLAKGHAGVSENARLELF